MINSLNINTIIQGTMDQVIRRGEIGIGSANDTLATLVGSCVAVILYDVERRHAGLAHIQLPHANNLLIDTRPSHPQSQTKSQLLGKYADNAIPELIRLIQMRSGRRCQLIAHLAGGADMFISHRVQTIGRSNSQAVHAILANSGIPVFSADCGGIKARRLTFDIKTGVLQIRVIDSTGHAINPKIIRTSESTGELD